MPEKDGNPEEGSPEEEIEVIDLTEPEPEPEKPEKPVKKPEPKHTTAKITKKPEPEITCPRCNSKEPFEGLGLYKCNKCGLTFVAEKD